MYHLWAHCQSVVWFTIVCQSNVTQKLDMQFPKWCLTKAWHVSIFPMNQFKELIISCLAAAQATWHALIASWRLSLAVIRSFARLLSSIRLRIIALRVYISSEMTQNRSFFHILVSINYFTDEKRERSSQTVHTILLWELFKPAIISMICKSWLTIYVARGTQDWLVRLHF